MGKKEEEEIIRIAKKMDKMAQKKNGVRCLRRMNALPACCFADQSDWCVALANVGANRLYQVSSLKSVILVTVDRMLQHYIVKTEYFANL